MTDLNLPPQLAHELNDALDACETPTGRAALLRSLTSVIYTTVRGINTGDGLDGYDSPERTAIGRIYTLVDQHFFDLAKSERQT